MMLNRDQAIMAEEQGSWWQKAAKKTLIAVFSRLPEGQLTLKEQGHLVERFGDPDSDLHAEVNILDPKAYAQLLFGGSVASGETYVEQLWETPNLTNVIRIFARNLPMLDDWEKRLDWLAAPMRQLSHWRNRNTHSQAKKNIGAHYDLGNRLYTRFLDDSMMYSAAIYPSSESSLGEAQNNKLRHICKKLQLSANDHLLEIGTGWGGLAIYAAKHYGCRVTTTTISEEQYAYARDKVAELGLSEQITLLKQDYRELTGEYDKLVSIEMIEAVGKDFLPTFFEKCQSLLKADGLMLLQAITINDQRFDSYSKGVDFIQKHIFPGGFLPSQLVLNQHLKKYTDMNIRHLQDIGLDYARTLQDWRVNLKANADTLKQEGYDQRFMRLWDYYFCYCEGGFLERTISTVQLLLSRPGFRDALAGY